MYQFMYLKKREKILPTQEKKLKNVTFSKVIPFTSNEVVKNLSSFEISTKELELLKYGLFLLHHKLIFFSIMKFMIKSTE